MHEEPSSNRYLVTGCAGFVGARVCELLLETGHRVVGVDNLNSAYDPRIKHWRLARLQSHQVFAFHEMDLLDADGITACCRAADTKSSNQPLFQAVFHLAARAGVRQSVETPREYIDTNAVGTLHVLEACRKFGIPKLVLASSSSLYTLTGDAPAREDMDTSHPQSPYAASKKAAEVLAYSYHFLHNLDISVLRYFTVYGPAGRPDMSVFRFVRQIVEGEPLVVFGDGRQDRDFTFVDDIVRGTIAAARPLGFEIINLGSDRPVALSDLIHTIAAHSGNEPRIEHRESHPADVRRTWADIGKAKRILGWQPEVPIEQGIAATVEWYLANRAVASQIEL